MSHVAPRTTTRKVIRARRPRFSLRLLAASVWTTFALCVASWGLRYLTDQYWLSTLLAFGPRWLLLVPMGILVPVAVWWQRRSLWVLAGAALVVLGPVMGFVVPWPGTRQSEDYPTSKSICILTCNVQGRQNLERLWELIETTQPDVVTLQECPANLEFPLHDRDGWHVARHGHLLVASRFPILGKETLNSPLETWRGLALRCRLQTPTGDAEVCCVHLMTPRSGILAVLHSRLAGIPELKSAIIQRDDEAALVSRLARVTGRPVLLAGDFNMPVESHIYQKCWGDFSNAFTSSGWGWGFTKYTRWHGVRIDQIVGDQQWKFSECHVAGDVGSDHLPVIARVVLRASR